MWPFLLHSGACSGSPFISSFKIYKLLEEVQYHFHSHFILDSPTPFNMYTHLFFRWLALDHGLVKDHDVIDWCVYFTSTHLDSCPESWSRRRSTSDHFWWTLGLGVSKCCGIREPRQVRVCSKQDMECATQRCLRHLDSSYHGIGKQTGPIIPLTELWRGFVVVVRHLRDQMYKHMI